MKIADINPHIRFAEELTYSSKNRKVSVKDCRIFYISGGKGKIFIDNSEFTLCKNTLFYCCGGSVYTIHADEQLHLYSLNFDLSQAHRKYTAPFIPQEISTLNQTQPVDFCSFKDSDFLNTFFVLNNAAEFKSSMSSIIKEYSDRRIYFRETCSALLKKLIIDLHKKPLSNQDNSSDAVNKIIKYINLNFTKEIKNKDLSEIAGYHEYYLNRLFIRYTGMSMHKYILSLRINESKKLLLNTNLPISDIASQIGFNSNTHFSTYFKKELGITPFEYRNNFKNNI